MQPTARTTIHRKPQRGSYDREVIHRILDDGLVAHCAFAIEGQPYVIPMVYARLDDQLVLHGAIASRMLAQGAGGVAFCATITIVDGLVLARSWFHHSMNYRSVVVLGTAREISERGEKLRALEALVEHALPGRAHESRAPSEKELAATRVIALSIDEASAKCREGGPLPDDDGELPWWSGVVPLALRASAPVADADVRGPLPASLARWMR